MAKANPIELESKSSFAKRIGVTPQFVTKLVAQGRVILDGTGRLAKVKVKESLDLYHATTGEREDVKARHAGNRKDKGKGSESPLIALQQSKLTSDSRRAAARADTEELERDKLLGRLLDIDDVNFVLDDFGATFVTMMETMPDRLAPIVLPLDNLDEVRAAIAKYAEQVQVEMAETMKQRAKS